MTTQGLVLCLGPCKNEGNNMCQWVLQRNGQIVQRQSLRHLTSHELSITEQNSWSTESFMIKSGPSLAIHSPCQKKHLKMCPREATNKILTMKTLYHMKMTYKNQFSRLKLILSMPVVNQWISSQWLTCWSMWSYCYLMGKISKLKNLYNKQFYLGESLSEASTKTQSKTPCCMKWNSQMVLSKSTLQIWYPKTSLWTSIHQVITITSMQEYSIPRRMSHHSRRTTLY